MFLYIYQMCSVVILVWKRKYMFSPEFMKFLINYQKPEYTPISDKKEIKFNKKGGKLVEVFVLNK